MANGFITIGIDATTGLLTRTYTDGSNVTHGPDIVGSSPGAWSVMTTPTITCAFSGGAVGSFSFTSGSSDVRYLVEGKKVTFEGFLVGSLVITTPGIFTFTIGLPVTARGTGTVAGISCQHATQFNIGGWLSQLYLYAASIVDGITTAAITGTTPIYFTFSGSYEIP
jgi:hypothetical protein